MTKLRLARHREVPILQMFGWEVCGDYDRSFVLMQLRDASRGTEPVNLGAIISREAA